jgi:hypothetical protein
LRVTIFSHTSADVAPSLFLFGIGAALLPVTLINIIIVLTSREFTSISSASTTDMRIIEGGNRSLYSNGNYTSFLIPIEVDGTTNQYPSPTAFNLVCSVGLVSANLATIFHYTY